MNACNGTSYLDMASFTLSAAQSRSRGKNRVRRKRTTGLTYGKSMQRPGVTGLWMIICKGGVTSTDFLCPRRGIAAIYVTGDQSFGPRRRTDRSGYRRNGPSRRFPSRRMGDKANAMRKTWTMLVGQERLRTQG
jgi:hypothetical protein